MKFNAFHVFPIILLLSTSCRAEQDFYGIQIKNDAWAKNLVLGMNLAVDPKDLQEGPVLDHAIHAEASLKPIGNERIDFRVNVINDSTTPVSSNYEERDFFIYTKDGHKYPLIDTEEDSRLSSIEPKSNKTFNPSLGNLRIRNDEVLMIRCSFDLGKTEIFLFPWSKKEEIARLVSPAPPQEAPDSLKSRKKNKVLWIEGSPSRARLDQTIKNFVYKPVVKKDQQTQVNHQEQASLTVNPLIQENANEAHVIDYNKTYNFVTLNLGADDGLRQDMTITILRGGKTVAKAKVKQLRPALSAAILLPGTIQTEVRPGDKIAIV